MPESFSQRRRAEHARRRREERERIAADSEPSDLMRRISEGESSQLTTLPGVTFEDIFVTEEEAGGDVTEAPTGSHVKSPSERASQTCARGVEVVSGGSPASSSVIERTPEEQEKLFRAFVRKFRATEVEPEYVPSEHRHPDPLSEQEETERRCVLCKRRGAWLVQDKGVGRWWCTGTEEAACIRIAQGHLGGVTTPTRSSLSGPLRADGTCRGCKKPIKWVKTQRGKNMPVDVKPAPAGVDAFELVGQVKTLAFFLSEKKREGFGGDCYQSHFQTCEARDADT